MEIKGGDANTFDAGFAESLYGEGLKFSFTQVFIKVRCSAVCVWDFMGCGQVCNLTGGGGYLDYQRLL